MKCTKEGLFKRMIMALTVGILAIVMGDLVTKTYYQYIDKTEYYQVRQPVDVIDDNFKPCQRITMLLTRKSLIDTRANFTVKLWRAEMTDDKSRSIELAYKTGEEGVIISKNSDYVVKKKTATLPCELPDGEYYYTITAEYQVHGIVKYYTYSTETFSVKGGE